MAIAVAMSGYSSAEFLFTGHWTRLFQRLARGISEALHHVGPVGLRYIAMVRCGAGERSSGRCRKSLGRVSGLGGVHDDNVRHREGGAGGFVILRCLAAGGDGCLVQYALNRGHIAAVLAAVVGAL